MAQNGKNDNPVEEAAEEGKQAAEKAAYSPLTITMMRIGYAARGLIYGMMGIVALQVALGTKSRPADQQGAIAYLAASPLGRLLLGLILIGLVGYAIWGLIRAILDPLHNGTDLKGLALRAGYLVSAFSYAVLIPPTYGYISQGQQLSKSGSQTAQTQHVTASLLTHPWGKWLILIVGVIGFLGGIFQIYQALRHGFTKNLKQYALSAKQMEWIKRMGRFGTAARGVAFSLVGLFLVQAALYTDPNRAQGIDGALYQLALRPYGPVMLLVIAVGLIAFGAYSILNAWWFRLKS